jgi:two-component system sensor histidine kinase KdpD
LLSDTLTLANQLGATVFTFKGQDVADTILRFAREYRVGQVVIGKPHKIPWWRRLFFHEISVAEQLIFRAQGVTIIVIDANAEEQLASDLPAAPTSDIPAQAPGRVIASSPQLGQMLTDAHVRVWNDPVSREQLFTQLVEAAVEKNPQIDSKLVMSKLAERESQGSTFLNEGVALPHARIDGLAEPVIALGLTHAGVLDAPVEKPIEAVFLMLLPSNGATKHLQLLAAAGRMLQNRELRKQLRTAQTPAQAAAIIAGQLS